MMPNEKRSNPLKGASTFVLFLAYTGITIFANMLISSLLSEIVLSILSELELYRVFGHIAESIISAAIIGIIQAVILALLYRAIVFQSKKSPLPAIITLALFQVAEGVLAYFLLFLLYVMEWNATAYSLITTLVSLILFVLGFFLQRKRFYAEDSDNGPVRARSSKAAADNDPHFVGIDLDDIEKRNSPGQRIKRSLFNRFDTENDSERVIAQSSRDAIRVMEHKALDMQHEWNCDEKGSGAPVRTGSRPEHVIAPGSGNVHVTEHKALDMKHEWNCDDQR